MNRLACHCLFAVLILAVPCEGWAQSQPAAVEQANASDEAAIRKSIATYVEVFNQGNAKSVASHWSDDGTFESFSGELLSGHQALESHFTEYFKATKQAKLELVDTSITFLSPNVARETGLARVIVADEEPSETAYEAIQVKTTSGWKIDNVREFEAVVPPPTHRDELQALEWMVGSWTNEGEDASIVTTCHWTTNQNYLVRTFKVFVEDRIDFEGTQVIDWEPHLQAIRSWLFDSDGGFGVGRWSSEGNRWKVQTLNVLPDGRRGSSTNVYEMVDENTVRFSSIGRQAGGELLPSIKPATIVRLPSK